MAYQPKFARKNHRVSPFFVLLGVIVVPISLALTAVLLGKMAQSLSRPKATAQAAPENMAIMAQFDGFVSAKMDAARDTLTAAQTPENVPETTVPVREKVIIEIPDDAQVAPEHVAHIAEELDVDGLIQTVLCVQGCAHFRRQLFIVEGRTGHQLHQDEQHQQDGQQRKQRGEDTLERIFFHVR